MSTQAEIQALEQFVIAITRQLVRKGILPSIALEDIRDGAQAMADAATCPAKRELANGVGMLAQIVIASPVCAARPRLHVVGGTDLTA